MNDLISRQAAIDLVSDVCNAVMSGCESRYDPVTEDEVYKDVLEVDAILKCNKEVRIALRNMPSAQPERKWIPVSERLPEDGTDIFVTYVDEEETRIIPVNYGRGTWFDCIFDRALDSLKVTAWMPLPEPWKGDNNG